MKLLIFIKIGLEWLLILCVYLCVCACWSLSRVWLYATPWTPLSMGFPRQEYWSVLPFSSPGDLPGIEPCVSYIAGRLSIIWATREAPKFSSPVKVLVFWCLLWMPYTFNRYFSFWLVKIHTPPNPVWALGIVQLTDPQSFFCGNWLNFTLKVWFLLFSTDSVGTVRKFLKPFSLLNSFLSGNLPHKWQPPLPFQTLVYFLSPARFSCSPYIFFLSGFLSCTAFYTMYKKNYFFCSFQLFHYKWKWKSWATSKY